MAKVSLFKQDGSQAGEVTLNDSVFGIEPNESVVFDVVISQRASLRQGTHAHKTVLLYLVVVKTMASKRYRSCPSRFYPLSTMAWWWYCLRTEPT